MSVCVYSSCFRARTSRTAVFRREPRRAGQSLSRGGPLGNYTAIGRRLAEESASAVRFYRRCRAREGASAGRRIQITRSSGRKRAADDADDADEGRFSRVESSPVESSWRKPRSGANLDASGYTTIHSAFAADDSNDARLSCQHQLWRLARRIHVQLAAAAAAED